MNTADQTPPIWYQLDLSDVADQIQSPEQGLTSAEVESRQAEHGLNELVEKQRKSVWMMFLDQFKDFMILVLIAAAVVSGIIGEPADTIAITVIVLLNAILGFVQEYRAEKAMAALKKMVAPSANVLRGGKVTTLPVNQLVPGDRVLLEAGNIVPADLRLTEAVQLQIDEAALTGESLVVEKQTGQLSEEELPLGDRKNLAFKGTLITKGHGQGIVTETGMRTQLGQIAALLQDQEQGRTPLQKRLATFGQKLAYAIFAICIIVFVTGLLRGEPPLLMLLTAISLAVAAIPEALPAVITISLALGARKLVKQQALIRKLPAVETLGSVSYICTDKTGTLTQNRMTVEQVYFDNQMRSTHELPEIESGSTTSQSLADKPHAELLLSALSLCNDTRLDGDDEVVGDPTETALFELAREKGLLRDELESAFPRLAEIPFDAERKLMTTFHPWNEGKVVSITKGAAEEIVARATHLHAKAGPTDIDQSQVMQHTEQIAGEGLRTLGFALRIWDALPESLIPEEIEANLTLVGLVGMLDPPRPEAAESVTLCRTAGIHPVMITGDHPLTAAVIARRVGIIGEEETESVITGKELQPLTLEELEARVEKIRVYARVSPQQKLKIVQALQNRGHFVAMTGDGVNDAPALKRADIGVAMGITGTDVSKEAAHMILLDDNFSTIVKTVREGRRIFDNIRKFIKYTMTSNLGEIWTIFLAPLLGLPIPLLPIHILWINLVTDGIPGLALTAEPGEKNLMQRSPRHPQESIFAHGLGAHIIWVGLLMGAVSLFTQAWFIDRSQEHWQTMVFTVLCLSQMGHVLAIRSERESFFSQGPLSNKPLFGAVLLTFILQMGTIYIPVLNDVFKTAPLTPAELGITLALSSIVFIAVEVEKTFKRKKNSL